MSTPVRFAGSIDDPYLGQYRDGYFDSSNLRLHYTEWNPAGGRVVVLVHGLNVQLHTWDPIAARLAAAGNRVVCMDLRGHGDSEWASEGYHLAMFISDLLGLFDHLQLGEVDLVGHSLGARIAIGFTAQYPDRVGRLVLSDTGPETTRAGALAARDVVGGAGDVRGFRDEGEALAFFEKAHPEWVPEFRELHLRFQLRRNWAGKLVFKADPDLFWILGSIAKNETQQLWAWAGQIKVPILLTIGETSPFFDDELVERIRAGFPALTVQYFPSGHYIPRELPDEFTRSLQQFFNPAA